MGKLKQAMLVAQEYDNNDYRDPQFIKLEQTISGFMSNVLGNAWVSIYNDANLLKHKLEVNGFVLKARVIEGKIQYFLKPNYVTG